MSEDTEVTLKQFINSIWFKGLSRTAVLLLLPLAGYLFSEYNQVSKRVAVIETDRSKRIIAADERASQVDRAIISINASIDGLERSVGQIDGKLNALLRERAADRVSPDWLYDGILTRKDALGSSPVGTASP